ncbi:hypothetical protein [Candidatus Similichlamydia epinepheli]|uniref:hypothetical protein n=1 Tax=Candidatus Similichlamydia epinepheli TaxID=1903953 RepID=UPI000D37998E|nr:hypothetical protein [Candidatus Similichlamydia epinepheli]
MQPIRSLSIGSSDREDDRPPPSRNNNRGCGPFSYGVISVIVMLIVIFIGILFSLVIPGYFSENCARYDQVNATTFTNGCGHYPYNISSSFVVCLFSIFNFISALLIILFMDTTSCFEVGLFCILAVIIFLLTVLFKTVIQSESVDSSVNWSVACYVVSQLVLLASFVVGFYLKGDTNISGLEQFDLAGLGLDSNSYQSINMTPPPPYTYLPMYDQIAMADLSPDPPPYQEPPPVYTSQENLEEEETEFGENGSEEDPYEDMPPLED